MKFSLRILVIAAVLIIVQSVAAAEDKKVLVAGFINKDLLSDTSTSAVISRSFITFLNLLPGTDIVPFSEADKLASENRFLAESNNLDIRAVKLGQLAGADQVITGEYSVKNEKITLRVLVYETATRKVRLDTSRTGDAGMDIFETIDQMIQDIGGVLLGKKIVLARISIAVSNTTLPYSYYLNGKKIATVTGTNAYKGGILALEPQEITLRNADGQEVYRESVTLQKDQQFNVSYFPSAVLTVQVLNLDEPAWLFIDNIRVTNAAATYTTLPRVSSGRLQRLEVRNGKGHILAARNFSIEEGRNLALELDAKAGVRTVFFPVALLGDGLGARAGLDFFPLVSLKTGLSLNILYVNRAIIPGGEAEAVWYFIPNDETRPAFGLGGGLSHYFIGSGVTSLFARIYSEYWKAFLFTGVRFSFQDAAFYPELGIGLRF